MTAPLSAWLDGARPNTLPASVAPVVAGLAAAVTLEEAGEPFASVRWGVLALTAVVALALQVGVNYANDYSDGIRGTDDDRVGPFRLEVGESITFTFVAAAGFRFEGIADAVKAADWAWERGWDIRGDLPAVLDYVAAHEVAHMREMNHGARFWGHVGRVCPHMDESREWLRAHGPDLHRYGVNAG